jgi:hypothetical protein
MKLTTHGEMINKCKMLAEKLEGKDTHRNPRRGWNNNI